jgi:hypothetical protein
MEMQLPESFLIRVWTEATGEDDDQLVLRGSIQDVHSGHKTYFTSLELPLALLRASADRLAGRLRAVD